MMTTSQLRVLGMIHRGNLAPLAGCRAARLFGSRARREQAGKAAAAKRSDPIFAKSDRIARRKGARTQTEFDPKTVEQSGERDRGAAQLKGRRIAGGGKLREQGFNRRAVLAIGAVVYQPHLGRMQDHAPEHEPNAEDRWVQDLGRKRRPEEDTQALARRQPWILRLIARRLMQPDRERLVGSGDELGLALKMMIDEPDRDACGRADAADRSALVAEFLEALQRCIDQRLTAH